MEIDWSNYEAPVQVVADKMNTKLEKHILQAIQNVGVVVDKEELIKAMNYDREQYSKGFKNGYNKAIDDFVNALCEGSKQQVELDEGVMCIPLYCKAQFCEGNCNDCVAEIRKIAEQLKGEKTE